MEKKIDDIRYYKFAGLAFFISILSLLLLRLGVKYLLFALPDLSDTATDLIFTLILQLGVFIIGLSALYIFGLKRTPKQFLKDTNLVKPKWWMIAFPVLMGFIVIFATMGFSVMWQMILGSYGYVSGGGSSEPMTTVGALLIGLFLTGVMPALGEENMYRGATLNALSKYGGFWFAVFCSAAMFGLGHAYVDQIFYAFILGILSGYMTLKFKNILPAIIIHFMNNSMSVYLDYAETNGTFGGDIMSGIQNAAANNLFTVLAVWLLIVGAIVTLVLIMKYFHKQEQDKLKPSMPTEPWANVQAAAEAAELRDSATAEFNTEGETATALAEVPDREKFARKIVLRDHAWVIAGFILAIVATISTYIGGFLP